MIKIFQYECRRLVWNKFFLGFLLVLLFYGWQVLNRVTILGVSHTAPFSSWSFGDYLSRMLTLLWIGTLFFLTFFTSGKARRVTILTDAAPMSRRRYALARSAAALVGTGMVSLACLAEAAVFYVRYFGFVRLELLLPALVILPPALVFALGSGGDVRTGWLGALYMDAGADPLYVFAASRLFGDLERKLFPPVSFDARNVGSGIFAAVANPVRPGDPAFPRNRIAPCVPAKIAFLHQNFTFV